MNIKKTIVLLTCLIVLFGCSNTEDNNYDEQHLIIGEQFDLRGYDPGSTMSDFVRTLVFNNLIELNSDFKKTPALATEWKMSEDATVWTFVLRKGVFFHDHEPWNAEAAKFNLDYRKETTGKSWLSSIKSVNVLDEYLLEIQLKEPVYTFDSDLTPPFMAMISPKSVNENGEVINAIGTGPFMLSSWIKDQQFTMEANESYFEGAPILTKLTFKVIPDAQTRALALENQEIHMMSGREGLSIIKRLANSEEVSILKRTSQTSEVIYMNTLQGPLADLLVRKAVFHAIDLGTTIDTLLEGLAIAPNAFFSNAYDPLVATYIPKKEDVASLLKLAGYDRLNRQGILTNGHQVLSLRLVLAAGNEEDKLLSLIIQDQLKNYGINVELVHLEASALRDALSKKDYDLIMIGQWMIPHDEPTNHYLKGYWHSQSSYQIFTSLELDSKIEELQNSLDPQKRQDLHHQIQQDIFAAYAQIVVFHRNNVVIVSPKVKDFELSVGTWQLFRGLTHARIKD